MNEKFTDADTSPQGGTDEVEALLPDGIGLRLEAVRSLLARENNAVVAKDDPLLMVVTILNAFLGQVEDQNTRLKDGLSKLLAEKAGGYVKEVETASKALGKQLEAASAEGLSKHVLKLESFKSHLTWLAIIAALASLINAAIFVASFVR